MPRRRVRIREGGPQWGSTMIVDVLNSAAPRAEISSPTPEKNQYAIRFADAAAKRIAADLQVAFPGIAASPARTARSVDNRTKQLDVNYSTSRLGLALGISLKSVHLRDARPPNRYTHNMKRNEEELRIEASGYHRRQPYAVMVGVLFLPFDSCDDGRGDNPSSFGSWVRHLRPYTGRRDPRNDVDRFERIYVALYEPDGTSLRFFDVEADPPRSGRPPADGELRAADGRTQRLLSYDEFLLAVEDSYKDRNTLKFRWAEGREEPIDPVADEEDATP